MSLPKGLKETLEDRLGQPIDRVTSVSGGDINAAAKLQFADTEFFVKWNTQAPGGMFQAEARGLQELARCEGLKVPKVIVTAEASHDHTAFLVLEWLPFSRIHDQAHYARRLGEGLAALHSITQEQHGLDHDNFIGSLPQYNTPTPDWATFYAQQRIRPQMDMARQRGHLPAWREKLLDKLCDRLPQLVPNTPPNLLHGDLWSGNYASLKGDMPVIYDPAVYYGHREMDLAMMALFGAPPRGFYEAYQAIYPVDADYIERQALYQLYPVLVHMNLFGGGYAAQVDRIARQYIA